MKDLRECGEVGPADNGESIFSCLFCGDRFTSMELIINHINENHQDKITFEPEALKKRPRRKRRSELPVSEWIHLAKEHKKNLNRLTNIESKKEKQSKYHLANKEQPYDEKENSKPESKFDSRSDSIENEDNCQDSKQYSRPRRNKRKIKVGNKENNSYFNLKSKRCKRKYTKRKKIAAALTPESDEETPIDIEIKNKGNDISVENEPQNISSEKSNDIRENLFEANAIAENEYQNDKYNFENDFFNNDEDKEHENLFVNNETKLTLNFENSNFNNLLTANVEKDIKNTDIIKEEKQDNINEDIKTEIKIERDQNLNDEDNSNFLQQILENDRSDNSDSSNFVDGFSENTNSNSDSESDDETEVNHEEDEQSSFTDSDSGRLSEYKDKVKNNFNISKKLISQQKNFSNSLDNVEKSIENSQSNNDLTCTDTSSNKKRKRCTPQTRKMNEFGEYVCDLCGNTYKKATSLSRHRSDCREGKISTPRFRTRKENGMFPCNYENCTAEYQNVEEVFKHEKEIHGKKKYARPQIRKMNEFGEYVCDICGNVYKKGTSLSRHRSLCREGVIVVSKRKKRDRVRNDRGLYQCAFHSCSYEFSKVEDVIAHEKDNHKGGKKRKIGRMCEVCGKWLTSACSFKSHMLRHSGEKNYKCDQCTAAFYDKYALSLHRKVHTNIKEYECEYCDKKFSRAAEMRKHVRYIHLNIRPDPVICDLCGKNFYWKFDLKSHMRRHYNVKTIRCEFAECDQMFANRSDLKKHLITHNPDIKPWQCEICSNSFSRKSTLVKHQKLHTGTKDYTCSICGKAFAQSPGLYMHMKSHGFNLKPEGAGRYERVSHISYGKLTEFQTQMGTDRISNLNFKQNGELNSLVNRQYQNNQEDKSENEILNNLEENNCNNNSLHIEILDKDEQNSLELAANPIATIHIDSIDNVINNNMINNSTISTIGSNIQINLGRPIQIELGNLTQTTRH